ncbi:MAG: glycosyltransferase family 2 protein [Acidobacteria bacterium]|nr:glycosyltransferase family 2 protein [Acidobacteriota bacterium]
MNIHKNESISVFFPAFNDEATIAVLVRNALDVLPQLTDDFEVIVVNDGSTDSTPAILDELANTLPNFKVVHHSANQGYGAALRTGFNTATKNLVFYTDGDGQYDVREILSLHPLLTEKIDVVNGYKKNRADKLHRIIIGKLYSRTARLLFNLPIRDVDCDFRLIRRKKIKKAGLEFSSGVICVELVRKLAAGDCAFAEVPVNHYPRQHGQSQFFTFKRLTQTGFDFFSLWLKSFVLKSPVKNNSSAAIPVRAKKHD